MHPRYGSCDSGPVRESVSSTALTRPTRLGFVSCLIDQGQTNEQGGGRESCSCNRYRYRTAHDLSYGLVWIISVLFRYGQRDEVRVTRGPCPLFRRGESFGGWENERWRERAPSRSGEGKRDNEGGKFYHQNLSRSESYHIHEDLCTYRYPS